MGPFPWSVLRQKWWTMDWSKISLMNIRPITTLFRHLVSSFSPSLFVCPSRSNTVDIIAFRDLFLPWRAGGRSMGGTGKPFLTTCFCRSLSSFYSLPLSLLSLPRQCCCLCLYSIYLQLPLSLRFSPLSILQTHHHTTTITSPLPPPHHYRRYHDHGHGRVS